MINLSVIIPTCNRSRLLQNALESILKQTYSKEKFEVIIIDNGSTDDTRDVVMSYKSKIPNLIYHYDERPGLHIGRHDGYNLSSSDLLVFADDDIEAFPTWLEAISDDFNDPNIVMVGGKNLPKYEEKPPFWVLKKWYEVVEEGHCVQTLSLIDFGDNKRLISPFYIFGCNYSVRKKIIKEAGGFHPDGMPSNLVEFRGDGEGNISKYVYQNGMSALYDPLASVYHFVPRGRMTIDYFCQRSFRFGIEKSYLNLRSKNKEYGQSFFIKTKKVISSCIIRCKEKIKSLIILTDKTDFEKQIENAEKAGYNYHKYKYCHDSAFREWVHRVDYWE